MVLLVALSVNCFSEKMAYAEEIYNNDIETGVYIGEDQVREYMESMGMEYNPDVLAIYIKMEDQQPSVQPRIDINLDLELELRNTKKATYIEMNDTLHDSPWPNGHVDITTSITKGITYSVESTDARFALELLLGFSFSQSITVAVRYEEFFDTPVRTVLNPIYEVHTGEIWEDDVWKDDYWGDYEVKKLVGGHVWVWKAGEENTCSE